MLESLNRRNGGKANSAQDILTAVRAHQRRLVLVTDDLDLAVNSRLAYIAFNRWSVRSALPD
jgi:hypothetical protein